MKTNKPPDLDEKLLAAAAMAGSRWRVQRLMAAGADPAKELSGGRSALAAAAMAGQAGAVEELLRACSFSALRRQEAIVGACWQDNAACVALLADGEAATLRDGQGATALMMAASAGALRCVEALLPLSDPKAADAQGRDALMRAAMAGNMACANALAPASDLAAKGEDGRGAAELADGFGYDAVARAVRSGGGHAAPKGEPQGEEAGLRAREARARGAGKRELFGWELIETAQRLARERVRQGRGVSSSEWETGLWAAEAALIGSVVASAGSGEALAALLATGEFPVEKRVRAIAESAFGTEGTQDMLRMLAGREVGMWRGRDGATALMGAARGRSGLVARGGAGGAFAALLPWSDPLARDREGLTALMLAAQSGSEEKTLMLLPGSDLSAKDKRGFDAAFFARRSGAEGLAETIRSFARARAEAREIGLAAGEGSRTRRARPAL